MEETDWYSRTFPVLKSNGKDMGVVTDFKNTNINIQRPTNPTESDSQLVRHMKPNSRYFTALDLCSG